MDWKPLFMGLGFAAGGSALLSYLKIREIVDQSWGWYPAEEVSTLFLALVSSLLICLLALIMATRVEKRPEMVENRKVD